MSARESRHRRLLLFLPLVLAFAIHARGLWNGFGGDDPAIVVPRRSAAGANGWKTTLSSDWFATGSGGQIGYYRPVTKASFRLTQAIAGARPFTFHLGNVLLHVAAVGLLLLLARRIAGTHVALLAASLFAVHPMTVQAVQAVAARSDLLAAAFGLLATLAFLIACDGSRAALAVSAAATALAIGSKESAALVLVVLLAAGLLHEVPAGRLVRLLALPAAATALVVAARLAVARIVPLWNPLSELSWPLRLACVLKAVAAYVLPALLGEEIVRLPQAPATFLDPGVLAGALVAAISAALLVRTRGRSPAAFAAVLGAAALAPALAVWVVRIPMWRREIPIAERWLYFPIAGVCLLTALGLSRLPRRLAIGIAAALVAAYGCASVLRVPAYDSDLSYTEFTAPAWLDHAPRNPREEYLRHAVRGELLARRGHPHEALAELLDADRIGPLLATHLLPMARVQLQVGDAAGAVSTASRWLAMRTSLPPRAARQQIDFGDDLLYRTPPSQLLEVLGRALAASGRPGEARGALDEAVAQATTDDERARLRAVSDHLFGGER